MLYPITCLEAHHCWEANAFSLLQLLFSPHSNLWLKAPRSTKHDTLTSINFNFNSSLGVSEYVQPWIRSLSCCQDRPSSKNKSRARPGKQRDGGVSSVVQQRKMYQTLYKYPYPYTYKQTYTNIQYKYIHTYIHTYICIRGLCVCVYMSRCIWVGVRPAIPSNYIHTYICTHPHTHPHAHALAHAHAHTYI